MAEAESKQPNTTFVVACIIVTGLAVWCLTSPNGRSVSPPPAEYSFSNESSPPQQSQQVVLATAYSDEIAPDEDLLLGPGAPSPSAANPLRATNPEPEAPPSALKVNVKPPVVIKQAPATPPATTVAPNEQPTPRPNPTRDRVVTPPVDVRPQPTNTPRPVATPNTNQPAPSPTTTRSDMNAGPRSWSNVPAPDEDLLIPGATATPAPQPSTGPPGVVESKPTENLPEPATPTQPGAEKQTAPPSQAPLQTNDGTAAQQPTEQQPAKTLDSSTQSLAPTQTPSNPQPAAPQPAVPRPNPQPVVQPTTPPQAMPPANSAVAPPINPYSNYAPHATTPPAEKVPRDPNAPDPHAEVFAETLFPSAKTCRKCHEKIYEEWASSSHAYAAISPMFQKFEQTLHGLTQGTVSSFCYRCHAPVATTLAHPREASIFDSIPSAREGVTCIACHRVKENYGKVNGERRIEPGDIHEPVYGSGYGEGLAEVLRKKNFFKVKQRGDKGPGQEIHDRVIHFDQISSSHFCVSCHQVAVAPGIALEVVWAQYRNSPACKQGITCQECHMGREPGVAHGYDTAPVAVVNGQEISPHRKHSNHIFYGPGYSIAHPGLFPHTPKADDWTMEQWLQFDYRAGWGTEAFEDAVAEGHAQVIFPPAWDNEDDRADAREIVDANLQKLEDKRRMRHRLMENGSHLDGPIFRQQPRVGRPLNFHYIVTNDNLGHNMPSGSLGAQPQLWLNVALTGPNGEHVWESGYVDANGDIADVHSHEVAAGRIARDTQLFNLQTKFLITGVKGTDREMALPVNTDFDQLPFIRASGLPVTVLNHPPFIRMEAHSLPPTGHRPARYTVPAHLMKQPGLYRLSVRMRFRAEPIYFMRFCKATREMERNMNYWMLDFHEESYTFTVQ